MLYLPFSTTDKVAVEWKYVFYMNDTCQKQHCLSFSALSSFYLRKDHSIPSILKMEFICQVCYAKFITMKGCFDHLKFGHMFRDNAQTMQCVVNHHRDSHCNKSYNTFDGLRKHVKICLANKAVRVIVIYLLLKPNDIENLGLCFLVIPTNF